MKWFNIIACDALIMAAIVLGTLMLKQSTTVNVWKVSFSDGSIDYCKVYWPKDCGVFAYDCKSGKKYSCTTDVIQQKMIMFVENVDW